ncbi:hypothetical protein [Antribacter gilvus]|uniref:hypothetical protein n=1 Tax=Antribacter gilvus TaxID=2304675 RepID=UPI000F76D1D1|nr:hypothetical protein [Antribacter gilvus]
MIDPVIEVAGERGFDLWPVLGHRRLTYLALHGGLSDRETGSAVYEILHWFHTDDDGAPATSVDSYLQHALGPYDPEGTQPLAMGGLRFTDATTGVTILPGCCYSIDERIEVYGVLDGGTECWLGHSPDGRLTICDGVVEIVQDTDEPSRGLIRATEGDLRAGMADVEAKLSAFVGRVADWALEHAPAHADRLAEVVALGLVVERRQVSLSRRSENR